jgi:hypothetical protein
LTLCFSSSTPTGPNASLPAQSCRIRRASVVIPMEAVHWTIRAQVRCWACVRNLCRVP